MHNGMLQLSGEKMSKSLGNLITIDEFLADHQADALRVLIYTGHYRKPVMFNSKSIAGAERSLARIVGGLRPTTGSDSTSEAADTLRVSTENARASFIKAMDDDFNTSSALAVLFELVKAINTARSAGVGGPFFTTAQKTLRELGGVLGLTLNDAGKTTGESSVEVAPFIDLLLDVRNGLRTAKQWELADSVRDRLTALGVVLEDGADGTTWRIEKE